VTWKKRFGEHVVTGLGYQFGGVPGELSQGSTGAAALGVHLDAFNASGFVNEANNHGVNQHSYSIGGNYQVGVARLGAGYFRYGASQGALGDRTDDAFTVSTKVAPIAGHLELDLGWQRIHVRNAAYSGGGTTIRQFGDTSSATTTGSGAKSTVYGSVIYHFNKLTQVYLAGDHATVSGGYRASGAVAGKLGTSGPSGEAGWSPSQTELAAGMRLIF
jgi:predicted porin